MASISFLSYIYAIYIKPEYAQLPIQKSDEDFLDLLKKLEDQPHKKVCAYCQIEKPEKARHCFICKRCVIYHDKHSYFLNNCIGKDNRGFMIVYLICTTILLSCIVLSALFHFTHVIDDEDYTNWVKVKYFKILTGTTGSLSLIILIPTI